MTAPLRATPQSQLPAAHTAPVAEFRCLYTPDVRKKQKKWQDGFLKFHTFNNRVMVYDQARNFLGDTYYKDGNELHEGDELTLDKGVMVEVADAIRVTQTDLKPLFEKKAREAPPPQIAPPRRFQPPSQVARLHPTPSATAARANAQQLRHKSLNTLLGTSKGPIGKAVPIKSPYEARVEQEREKENDFAVDRAAKRRKTTHESTSSATMRRSSPVPTRSLAPPKESDPVRTKSSNTEAARKPTRLISPKGAPVITLHELDAVTLPSSQASLPSTPPVPYETIPEPCVTPAPPARPTVTTKPTLQTPKLPRGKVPVPSVKALETLRALALPSSPPVSASNRLTNVDFAIHSTPAEEPNRSLSNQSSPPLAHEPVMTPPRNPKAKSLRLSKGVKRGTLMMCQPPPILPRPRGHSEARCIARRLSATKTSNASRRILPASEAVVTSDDAFARSNASKTEHNTTAQREKVSTKVKRPAGRSPDDFDDPDIMHGLMDQQLMVPRTPPPEPIVISDSPELVPTRPKARNAVTNSPQQINLQQTGQPHANKAASLSHPSTVAGPTKAPAGKQQTRRKPSPPFVVAANVASIQSRAASPVQSTSSESRSRTTSLSPHKPAALSTGGFHKRPKGRTPQSTHPGPDKPPAASRNETVTLPPHPLRAKKNGPVMTTTELAAMLQQPKKRTKAPADPIIDGNDATGASPSRKFRRVRSENDAPIPSTSEDWEKRNLPKATPAVDMMNSMAIPEPPTLAAKKESGLAGLIKKTDPRKKLVRTQSLAVETTISPAQEAESPMVSPVVDEDTGPWSTEAFDLFDWRPPGRENLGI